MRMNVATETSVIWQFYVYLNPSPNQKSSGDQSRNEMETGSGAENIGTI